MLKESDNMTKYRIVKVVNHPFFGCYYKVQYFGGFLIKHWKDYCWDYSYNGQDYREFRCFEFDVAQSKLEQCKRSNGDPHGYYEEIVYEE